MNTEYIVTDGFVTNANKNTASVAYWGGEEKAKESLESLKECVGCLDCSYCSYCSGCSGCSGCSDCSYCSYCSYCSDCSDCSECSYCSYCSGCSDCSGCVSCVSCSGCVALKKEGNILSSIPKIENIHSKIYEAVSHPNALNMKGWHTCDTTHCRGGWVVRLAGEKGYELEKLTSTIFAAQQIYKASGYEISLLRFFDDNEKAMADMKRLAEEEKDQQSKVAE